MKKRLLEKKKKKRMPAFKTGIYQPSPPKYLVSADVSLCYSDYCIHNDMFNKSCSVMTSIIKVL